MLGGVGCAETVNNYRHTPGNVSEERRPLRVAYIICSLGYRPKGVCRSKTSDLLSKVPD